MKGSPMFFQPNAAFSRTYCRIVVDKLHVPRYFSTKSTDEPACPVFDPEHVTCKLARSP